MVTPGWARAALALVAVACVGNWAGAQQPLYGTSFDGPGYPAGATGGPTAADGWAPAGDQMNRATVSNGALRITSLNDPAVRGLSAAWVRQLMHDGSAADGSVVTYSADVRIDGPGTGTGKAADVLSANLVAFGDGAARPTAGQMWLSANGTVYAGTSPVTPGEFEAAAGLGTTHTLAMALDFGDRTASYFLDGQKFGEESFSQYVTSPILGGVVLGAGGPPDAAKYNVDDYAITVDNVSVTAGPPGGGAVTTPEPTTLALAALGLVVVAGRGRRKW